MKVLFLSDLGPDSPADHGLSGPQRFARAFSSAISGRVSLTIVNLSEGNKLSRSLTCLGGYDIYHVSGVSFLEPLLAGFRSGRRLIYTSHGILAHEARAGYQYPKRMFWAENILVGKARAIACVSNSLCSNMAREFG
ncbi:MAG: glycosyltransferase, partial [Candidatus Hydrothermia bacterium]